MVIQCNTCLLNCVVFLTNCIMWPYQDLVRVVCCSGGEGALRIILHTSHCTALYCTALHCTSLNGNTLHCTALYCTAQLCTALQYWAHWLYTGRPLESFKDISAFLLFTFTFPVREYWTDFENIQMKKFLKWFFCHAAVTSGRFPRNFKWSK